jgi:demethylmenaquinone methyltransferase/2-methoxy-6-polyprenyl-1,4-benzoquinol methylase/phosphoethanolamine N-methyltransferase
MKSSNTDSAPATRGAVIHWAGHYDQMVSLLTLGRRARLRKMTIALARIQPGDRVLEVGCGTGDVAIAACAPAGPSGSVSGIDAGPEMIAVARAKAARAGVTVDFRVEPIEALTYPDDTFDIVLSSLMMHHLPDDLKRQGLAEIARVLKPGGRLLIVDVKRPSTRLGRGLNILMMHGRLKTAIQDLPAMLADAGYIAIEAGATDFHMLGFVRGQIHV